MLGIDVSAPPLPQTETRLEFMKRYAEDSERRLAVLRAKDEPWWSGETQFFDAQRSRARVMTRRIAHTKSYVAIRGRILRRPKIFIARTREQSYYGTPRAGLVFKARSAAARFSSTEELS